MQEIGLATEAIFIYGSARIPWQDLYSACDVFEKEFPKRILREYAFEPSRVTQLYKWHSRQVEQSFLDLLITTETRSTTDPRDRVFAPSKCETDFA
jgi:hypothetical protein